MDKFLDGAIPQDFSVAQPAEFELVMNLKNAGALGREIPQSILVCANSVFGR